MSRPSQPSGSESYGTTCVSASASNADAATTSTGSTTSNSSGFDSRISSAIFPPTSTSSARPPRLRSTPSLSSTFAPPEMRANGRSTSPSSRPSISSSRSSNSPAYAGRSSATPTVDACARCADPNASITNRSRPSASSRAKPGSFFVSPGLKRVFSSTTSRSSERSSRSRSSTGAIENAGSGSFGRPRWEHTATSDAPRSSSSSSVGSAARIRVSSATRPSSSGTFRSARTSTRLPVTSASRTERARLNYAGTASPTEAAIFSTTSARRQL